MDVLSIGETMIVFSPKEDGPMRYAHDFTTHIAGAETNTLIGLEKLGVKSGWISQLGNDELGHKILSFVRGEGINVDSVTLNNDASTGLFLKEKLNQDQTRVHYYRSNSAASKMTDANIDLDYVAQFKYLYVTGITPALSENCKKMIFHLIDEAKKLGLKIIFDPNLRLKLWAEDEARETLINIIALSDIVLPGISEGAFLFGDTDEEIIANKMIELGASTVVVKLGSKGAFYKDKNEAGYAQASKIVNVIDPVGAGDGFAAGFIAGYINGLSLNEAVEQGCNVGALVTTVKGDVEGLPTLEALEQMKDSNDIEDVIR
ncbi:sugar kinase [Mammaliicoccus sp. Dog046]|uniref:sugar kinase n=1 Tax=Mammaliicoccus sp. Dog046 TaxID=3034233 RepID=UPI002B25E8B9|nr:sugar kinase [Mammaliicoccus sp. Dog046]WQK86720.1 sugar kinase [Mammaliicoccus sp. Dog046]